VRVFSLEYASDDTYEILKKVVGVEITSIKNGFLKMDSDQKARFSSFFSKMAKIVESICALRQYHS